MEVGIVDECILRNFYFFFTDFEIVVYLRYLCKSCDHSK